ncbi:MAG TPA: Fic family protein [Kineosporiaceae bacterium]
MPLFDTPQLRQRDLEVLAGIDAHRASLRSFLSTPRRWKGQLRRNLRARAVRGSNSIEGYEVSLDDALALVEGDEAVDADHKTILEVSGYRNAMTYVQQLAEDSHFTLDQSLLRSLHFMMLGHDLSKSPGSYRKGPIFVRDEDADETVYEGPDHERIGELMAELVEETSAFMATDTPVFVTAAMAHLNLVMIHPFRDGNGRMARTLQTLILARNQILSPEFSSIEEWLGRNSTAYYEVLSQVGQGSWHPENDASPWVQFNLRAHHMQAQTVLDRVNEAEDLWTRLQALAAERRLPERTISALYEAALGLRVRRTRYQEEAGVEDATAGRDLRIMAERSLLLPQGQTRGRYYVGSPELREIYRALRTERPRRIVDPYDPANDDLGPHRRKRMITVEPDHDY